MNREQFNLRQNVFLLLVSLLFITPLQAKQICNNDTSKTAPDNRYHNNGDRTVSDLQTGLMWQQCSLGQSGADCASGSITTHNWNQALRQSENFNSHAFAGYTDWRLPTKKELESLVERSCVSSAINETLFPNTKNSLYWSSSPNPKYPKIAWSVNFNKGYSCNYFRNLGNSVRLVRNSS